MEQVDTIPKLRELGIVSLKTDTGGCELQPGQASFHHGWTLHASMPNHSSDRRIGLNAQYLATHMRQIKNDGDSAMLVRGHDAYGHFATDVLAKADLEPAAVEAQAALERRYQQIATAK